MTAEIYKLGLLEYIVTILIKDKKEIERIVSEKIKGKKLMSRNLTENHTFQGVVVP